MGLTITAARWPEHEAGIAQLDTSYTTDRVYRLQQEPLGFRFNAVPVDPPWTKSFAPMSEEIPSLRAAAHVVVAEEDGRVVGMAAATVEEWNRRARVEHFFVDASARRRGVGRSLMASVVAFARERGCWCVWLETQAENYPAVQFYRRVGFRLCGLDTRLYDPASEAGGETALFLALDLRASPTAAS